MSRRTLINLDLRGQMLDASVQAGGHARESLVQGCTFDLGTRFVGGIRGTGFIGNTAPADWRAAQTYSCSGRWNPVLVVSVLRADIVCLVLQPVGSLIRDAV